MSPLRILRIVALLEGLSFWIDATLRQEIERTAEAG